MRDVHQHVRQEPRPRYRHAYCRGSIDNNSALQVSNDFLLVTTERFWFISETERLYRLNLSNRVMYEEEKTSATPFQLSLTDVKLICVSC